jgi:hypothetical protein
MRSKLGAERLRVEQSKHLLGKRVGVLVVHVDVVPEDLASKRTLVGEAWRSGAHRLEKGGVRSADGVPMDVQPAVPEELRQAPLILHLTQVPDVISRRCSRAQLPVQLRAEARADHHMYRPCGCGQAVERIEGHEDVVLRNDPGDSEGVLARPDADLGELIVLLGIVELGAVGDVSRAHAEAVLPDACDRARVGHECIGVSRGHRRPGLERGPAHSPPLATFPFEAVHVDDDRHAGPAYQRQPEPVAQVDDDRGVHVAAADVEARCEPVGELGEVVVVDASREHALGPVDRPPPGAVGALAAIDDQLLPAPNRPWHELAHERLVAAVDGGVSAAADQGDAHYRFEPRRSAREAVQLAELPVSASRSSRMSDAARNTSPRIRPWRRRYSASLFSTSRDQSWGSLRDAPPR